MELKINRIDSYELKSFVKKLLPIDKFIFMKISDDITSSSVYFPERDAVKHVNVSSADMFEFKENKNKDIKVSFYNGSKVIDALSHFPGEVTGKIKYFENDGELMASDFTIEDDNLSIILACADPSLSFMEMTKEETDEKKKK